MLRHGLRNSFGRPQEDLSISLGSRHVRHGKTSHDLSTKQCCTQPSAPFSAPELILTGLGLSCVWRVHRVPYCRSCSSHDLLTWILSIAFGIQGEHVVSHGKVPVYARGNCVVLQHWKRDPCELGALSGHFNVPRDGMKIVANTVIRICKLSDGFPRPTQTERNLFLPPGQTSARTCRVQCVV